MKLRKYQNDTVEYIEASYAFGARRIIVDSPTGSGKSLMIAEACKRMAHENIVILVNVSKLIGQISEHLDVLDIDHSILKSGMEDKYDETKRVQLVMEQTYDARKDKIHFSPEVFIRDEHHIGFNGSRFNSLLDRFSPKLVVGFSATPYDHYGVALDGYETAAFTNVAQLTDNGYLMPGDTWVPSVFQKLDYSKIGKSGDYSESELDDLLNNDEYNQEVVKEYNGFYGRKAIVFVSGIDHAEDLCAKFNEKGVNAYPYHSKKSDSDNEVAMADFKSGLVDVLVSVSSLTTGFDFPECSMVINCRPTKVRSLYVQMVGRVLRTTSDPLERAIILDCCKATSTHGLYDTDYPIPKTKSDASEERKRRSEPIIDYMAATGGTTLKIERSTIRKAKKQMANDNSIPAMVWRFENANTAKELVSTAIDLHERFYGSTHKGNTFRWILETVEPDIKRFGIGPFRTRLRNIVKDGKKIAGIRYFGAWLSEQNWS